MLMYLPDPFRAEDFHRALVAAKGDRTIVQTSQSRFEVVEDPPLDAGTEAALLAIAVEHHAVVESPR